MATVGKDDHVINRTCSAPGCAEPHKARGLCGTHYNQAYQPNRHAKLLTECAACGAAVTKFSSASKARRPVCSERCKYFVRFGYYPEDKPGVPVRAPYDRKAAAREMWSPLREAIHTRDYRTIARIIAERAEPGVNGCHLWTGRLDTKGYPRVQVGGRQYAPYRLALEARMGAPLGDQPAHHTCATPLCVNPDHLQPVTIAANTAEMLARGYMVRRIEALESALRQLSPSHELLDEIGVAFDTPGAPLEPLLRPAGEG